VLISEDHVISIDDWDHQNYYDEEVVDFIAEAA